MFKLLGCSIEHNYCDVSNLICLHSRNRCMPIVTTDHEQTAHCIVPESPLDPSDPGYIDPASPSCLAKSVVTQQTKTQANNNDIITNALLNVQVFVGRYLSDIKSAYVVLGLAVLLSFVLGFVFLVFFSIFP